MCSVFNIVLAQHRGGFGSLRCPSPMRHVCQRVNLSKRRAYIYSHWISARSSATCCCPFLGPTQRRPTPAAATAQEHVMQHKATHCCGASTVKNTSTCKDRLVYNKFVLSKRIARAASMRKGLPLLPGLHNLWKKTALTHSTHDMHAWHEAVHQPSALKRMLL